MDEKNPTSEQTLLTMAAELGLLGIADSLAESTAPNVNIEEKEVVSAANTKPFSQLT